MTAPPHLPLPLLPPPQDAARPATALAGLLPPGPAFNSASQEWARQWEELGVRPLPGASILTPGLVRLGSFSYKLGLLPRASGSGTSQRSGSVAEGGAAGPGGAAGAARAPSSSRVSASSSYGASTAAVSYSNPGGAAAGGGVAGLPAVQAPGGQGPWQGRAGSLESSVAAGSEAPSTAAQRGSVVTWSGWGSECGGASAADVAAVGGAAGERAVADGGTGCGGGRKRRQRRKLSWRACTCGMY